MNERIERVDGRVGGPGWCRLDWRSALLFPTDDSAWQAKVGIGGLVLIIPMIGWVMLLGYRREAIFRLIRGDEPILPEWWGNGARFLVEGLKAVAVINTYYLPVYLWVGVRLSVSPAAGDIPWVWMLAVSLVAPIFSTLAVPAILAADRFLASDPTFTGAESAGIAAAFGILTFVIPSGFLNVSRTGRTMSALDLPRALARIIRSPRVYAEAWVGSGLVSLAGHLCGVFAPWGVAWCYLAIVYAFNEVPVATGDPDAAYLDRSWFVARRRDRPVAATGPLRPVGNCGASNET
ncbi:MAG: DUF4013 domain-containing protein [Planctomycetota bacterium]